MRFPLVTPGWPPRAGPPCNKSSLRANYALDGSRPQTKTTRLPASLISPTMNHAPGRRDAGQKKKINGEEGSFKWPLFVLHFKQVLGNGSSGLCLYCPAPPKPSRCFPLLHSLAPLRLPHSTASLLHSARATNEDLSARVTATKASLSLRVCTSQSIHSLCRVVTGCFVYRPTTHE